MPPAKGFKAQANRAETKSEHKRVASLVREGGGRSLSENPDQSIKATVKSCQSCGEEIAESLQQLMQRYDKIDIPPIVPIITRVERYGCNCPHCGALQIGAVPLGMESGSPFGERIAALVITLRYCHGISYARMAQMLSEVFGLKMSQGAIANLLSRVKGQLQSEVDGILKVLRKARLVCSDETSARVNGKNQWEWVFQNEQMCLSYYSSFSRGRCNCRGDERPSPAGLDLRLV